MKYKSLAILAMTLLLQFTATLPAIAQTYNDGAYGGGVYSGVLSSTPTPSITPTPNTIGGLPVTGATVLAGTSLGAILLGIGLIIWAKNRHQAKVGS